ncbi:MAG: recombinase family protein [Muribaculaceae bacterium]|nr:recombinase family protein [Alistipes senegalensis]MCM1474522.1 recombinase family protein [Muribaculaceae bacterium]
MSLRVAAYCRVSTEKESQANSLENQRKFFTDYINKNKEWTLVEVYYDDGASGTSTEKRDGFNRMIDDAYAGKIDLILIKEVSRFARNTVIVLDYTRKLKEQGVEVIFINDNISTLDSIGEMKLSIMSTMAQEESRKTSERVCWGQRMQMKKGVVFGRNMLGYDVKDGKLYINEEGAEIVRLIFHKYVNEGKGTHVIARELMEKGIQPMRVKEWSNTVILRILRNEKYVGDLCQQKTFTPNYLTHKKKYNRGEKEKIYIKNHHEPIIDRNTWEKAQEILAAHKPTAEQKSRHSCRYWCSGKIVCGECGEKFVSRTKKLKCGSGYKAWRCAKNAKHGAEKVNKSGDKIGCNNRSVNEVVLLEGTAYLLSIMKINRKELISEMISEIHTVCSVPEKTDIKKLKKDIDNIAGKKRMLLDRHLEGTVTAEDYKSQNQYYDKQISEIREKIERHQKMQSELDYQARKMQKCIEYVKKYLDFETADEHICGEVLEKITVYSEKILEIKLKYVPAVRLRYSTSGRGENYKVKFELLI